MDGAQETRAAELAAICDAIRACNDPNGPLLHADVPNAAQALLEVLENCAPVTPLGNVYALGKFMALVWGRVVRYGYDESERNDEHGWTMYLFNGATYEGKSSDVIKLHARACLVKLRAAASMHARVVTALMLCRTTPLLQHALDQCIGELRGMCQGESPRELNWKLDTSNFIGFTNGVCDVRSGTFFPLGSVPSDVKVSMCTEYPYVSPSDPLFPEMRAQITEFERMAHADNYNDPNDARLAAMRLFSGALLLRGNECKKVFVFLGSANSGKAEYARLLQLTLGDYAATGCRIALTRAQKELDRDLAANHKALVCFYPEAHDAQTGAPVTRINGERIMVLTGNDQQAIRAPRRATKGISIDFKPIVLSTHMPVVRPPHNAALNRFWIARFGATFVPSGAQVDPNNRIFQRIPDIDQRMRQWAPYYFVMMVEALRDFLLGTGALPLGQ